MLKINTIIIFIVIMNILSYIKYLWSAAEGERLRRLQRVGGRPQPSSVPSAPGRGPQTRVRLGHAEHKQPQRQHSKEVLPRCSPLHAEVRHGGGQQGEKSCAGRKIDNPQQNGERFANVHPSSGYVRLGEVRLGWVLLGLVTSCL